MGLGEGVGGVLEDGEQGGAVESPLGGGEVGACYVAAAAVDDYAWFDGSGFG